jgi:MFS transporter, SP family, arabinose:H+ symporter
MIADDKTETGEASYNLLYVWFISIAAAMGGLLFGYDWVVIGGAKPFYEAFFHLVTPSQIGWAMSSALIGCLAGAIASGILSDRFGRKRLLLLAAFLFTVSSIGTGMADTFFVFLVWRIAGGVAIGLASNLSPMYIAEVAPSPIRGQLVSVNQLTIVIGVLAAQVMNWLIARPVPAGATAMQILHSWNGQMGWRWMFAVTAVPSLLFLISMLIVPESPRWLAKNGQPSRARAVLARIGGAGFAQRELDDIEATLANEVARVDFRDLLEPKVMRILWLGIFLAVFQQWCGINVVFSYAQEVFAAAGYQVSDILLNIVVTGATIFVFTFVAIFTVDRFGRRPLMLIGAAGLAITYFLLGLTYHVGLRGWPVLMLVVIAVACYSFSLAPITWVVLSEIFPNRIRGAAMAVAVSALWAACFVLTYTFPFLNRGLGSAGTFWLYCAVCVTGFFVIWRKLPETKNKTLEQIERQLAGPVLEGKARG